MESSLECIVRVSQTHCEFLNIKLNSCAKVLNSLLCVFYFFCSFFNEGQFLWCLDTHGGGGVSGYWIISTQLWRQREMGSAHRGQVSGT